MSEVRYGFFDRCNNVFYEVSSKEEYERCLEYYQKMVEEEEKRRMQNLGEFDDFDDVIGEIGCSQGDSALPEMQEY